MLVPAAVSYASTRQPGADHGPPGRRGGEHAGAAGRRGDARAARDHRLPDVVVNSGTNAWWWWTLFGDIDADTQEAFTKIRTEMRRIVNEVFDRAATDSVTLRQAARSITEDQLALIDARFGRG